MNENRIDRLKFLIDLHNDCAEAYKAVEPVVEKMDMTTMNDIRYALRGMVDCVSAAISEESDGFFEDAVSRAELALRTVWHDVIDITVDQFRIYLNFLGKEYGPDIVAKFIDRPACNNLIYHVDDLVTQSRGDRSKRIDLYKQITKDHIKELIRLFRNVQDAEPAIVSSWKKEKRDNFLKYFAALASLIILSTVIYVNFIKS